MAKVGQGIPGSPFERPVQRGEFGQAAWYAHGDDFAHFGLHEGLAHARVGSAIGIDDLLAHTPDHLECDALIAGEQFEWP